MLKFKNYLNEIVKNFYVNSSEKETRKEEVEKLLYQINILFNEEKESKTYYEEIENEEGDIIDYIEHNLKVKKHRKTRSIKNISKYMNTFMKLYSPFDDKNLDIDIIHEPENTANKNILSLIDMKITKKGMLNLFNNIKTDIQYHHNHDIYHGIYTTSIYLDESTEIEFIKIDKELETKYKMKGIDININNASVYLIKELEKIEKQEKDTIFIIANSAYFKNKDYINPVLIKIKLNQNTNEEKYGILYLENYNTPYKKIIKAIDIIKNKIGIKNVLLLIIFEDQYPLFIDIEKYKVYTFDFDPLKPNQKIYHTNIEIAPDKTFKLRNKKIKFIKKYKFI